MYVTWKPCKNDRVLTGEGPSGDGQILQLCACEDHKALLIKPGSNTVWFSDSVPWGSLIHADEDVPAGLSSEGGPWRQENLWNFNLFIVISENLFEILFKCVLNMLPWKVH